MAIDKNLAAWQVLGVAIRSEVDAAAFYTRLRERVKNFILVQKLKFLVLEEEHHKKILERLLGQKYPDKPKDIPESSLMPPISVAVGTDPTVPALFEAALKAEELAEAYYNEAGERMDEETSRKILAYLGRVERSHQSMIRAELELIRKFPDYYSVEDFHVGQDLFHVGP
jgi:rubrerythrin